MAERNAPPRDPAQSRAEHPSGHAITDRPAAPRASEAVDLVFTRRGTDFTPGLPTDTELLVNNRGLFP